MRARIVARTDVMAAVDFAALQRYVTRIRGCVSIPTRVRRIAVARTVVRMAVMVVAASVMLETLARWPDNVCRQIRGGPAPAVARIVRAPVVTA